MGIISPPSGNFTPGALTALSLAVEMINASWDLGNTKSGELAGVIANTDTHLDLASVPTLSTSTISPATVTEPTVTIADTDPASIYSDFNTQRDALMGVLETKFAAFINEHFPDDDTLYASAETWLQNAMDAESGLPATVQAQIWGDDQARILAESSRAKDAVLATFATRRMPLPGGQAASAVLQIDQAAQDKLAESSRKIAVMSVEQFRFLIEKVASFRKLSMDACLEYIKNLATNNAEASRLVGYGYDAQSKMISAASQFLNSRVAIAEQINKVAQFNTSTQLDAAAKNQLVSMQMVDAKLKALLAQVTVLGQQCNALFNNLHANAGTQYTVNGT